MTALQRKRLLQPTRTELTAGRAHASWRRLAPASAALLLCSIAQAWTFELPAEREVMAEFAEAPLALADGGFVLLYGNGLRGNAKWALRYDAQGQVVAGPIPFGVNAGQRRSLAGDMLLNMQFPSDIASSYENVDAARLCQAQGAILGISVVSTNDVIGYSPLYNRGASTPRGAFATYYDFGTTNGLTTALVHFDPGCRRNTLLSASSLDTPRVTGDGELAFSAQSAPPKLLAFTAESQQWSLELPASGRVIGVAQNDDALVKTGNQLWRVSREGVPRWKADLPTIENQQDPHAAYGDSTATFAIYNGQFSFPRGSERQVLQGFAADGTPTFQVRLEDEDLSREFGTRNGDTLFLAKPITSPGAPATTLSSRLVSVAADGSLSEHALFDSLSEPKTQLAGGDVLIGPSHGSLPLQRLNFDSGSRAVIDVPNSAQSRSLLSLANLPSGAAAVVSEGYDALRIIKLDAQGELLWQRRVTLDDPEADIIADQDAHQLIGNEQRLCLLRLNHQAGALWCLNIGSGAPASALVTLPRFHLRRPVVRLRQDQLIEIIGTECTEPEAGSNLVCSAYPLVRLVVSSGGELISRRVFADDPTEWMSNADGSLAYQQEGTLHIIDSSDVEVAQIDLPAVQESSNYPVDLLAYRPQGLALIAQRKNGAATRVAQVNGNGDTDWVQTLPDSNNLYLNYAQPVSNGDWLIQRTRYDQPNELLRLSATSGEAIWSSRYRPRSLNSQTPPRIDATRSYAWLPSSVSPEGRIARLRLQDGQIDQAFTVGSARSEAPTGVTSSLIADPIGTQPTVAAWIEAGEQRLVVRSLVAQPGGDLDPSGIWQAEDTPGQGLILESYSGTQSLGGAWFTYSFSGGTDDSVLRWLSVQGQPSGASNAYDLRLFESGGGSFAEQAAQHTEEVGSATLNTIACDRALLSYSFTQGDLAGVRGAVPLVRTARDSTASTNACSGQLKQFSSHLSGTFFDPASNGQGLLLRSVGVEGGAALAGAWFTFDPAGQSNDADAQHWFTVQGPIADAGPVEAEVYSTLGGAFDFEPTSNTVSVGTLRINPQSCDRLELSWQFNDSRAAGAFKGLSGSRSMLRIGDCP